MSSKRDRVPEEPLDDLATLKARLDQSGNWPEAADRLLADLGQSQPSTVEPDQESDDLLSLVVNDALHGVDISARYPAFYQKMLVDADLQQAFLEALSILEQPAVSSLAESQPDLGFLNTSAVQPLIESFSPARWRLVWRAALEQLQSIFFATAQFEPVYRSDDYLEDAWFTLFRNEVDVDQTRLSVVLEGVRLIATPDELQLHLAVGLTTDGATLPDRLPDLRAQLTWGTYDQTVTITERGRATFPPLPLKLVLDETQQRITSALQLVVEPAL